MAGYRESIAAKAPEDFNSDGIARIIVVGRCVDNAWFFVVMESSIRRNKRIGEISTDYMCSQRDTAADTAQKWVIEAYEKLGFRIAVDRRQVDRKETFIYLTVNKRS